MANKTQRDSLRSKLLSTHKPESRLITLFGAEIELRQPQLQDVMKARETEDPADRAADMIIRYAYVPGTNERVFEEADKDTIVQWPFGGEFMELQKALTSLTGIDMDAAEAEVRQDPLDNKSSDSPSS